MMPAITAHRHRASAADKLSFHRPPFGRSRDGIAAAQLSDKLQFRAKTNYDQSHALISSALTNSR